MTPLERAIAICGTQSELARRVTGKPATGHVYHWLKNGVSEAVAIAIEAAVAACIAEGGDAAVRAADLGAVRVEELLPHLDWQRDNAGTVVSYTVRITPLEIEPARRSAAAPGGDAAATAGIPTQPMSEAA